MNKIFDQTFTFRNEGSCHVINNLVEEMLLKNNWFETKSAYRKVVDKILQKKSKSIDQISNFNENIYLVKVNYVFVRLLAAHLSAIEPSKTTFNANNNVLTFRLSRFQIISYLK